MLQRDICPFPIASVSSRICIKRLFQKMKQSKTSNSGELSQDLLIFLCTLYELRHLGRTAARLCISLPKASRMLAEARRIFDDPLFSRFGRGLAPTDRVHGIVEHARQVLKEMRLLFEEPCFDPAQLTRVFRLACLDNAFPIMVEPVLAPLLEKSSHSGLALLIHDEQTMTRMRAGEVDLAIFPADQLPADFESMKLLKTPYVQVVRAGHPLESVLDSRGAVTSNDLKAYRRIQIVVHPDRDNTAEGVPGPAPIPMKASETVLWTSYWLGAVRLMHQTDSVLTLPWRTALVLSKDRPLTVLGRAMSVPWLEPSLIWHQRSSADPALQWLRSLFAVHVRGGSEVVPDVIKLGRLGE